MRWSEFADSFIDHFLPSETKAARATDFESQKQCSISVWRKECVSLCKASAPWLSLRLLQLH